MKLSICTFNIRNYYLSDKNIRDSYIYKLKEFVTCNDIDVMGMQEVTKIVEKRVREEFGNYYLFGKYRYGHLPSLRGINEGIFILSKDSSSDTYSRYLIKNGFIYGSIVPRVMVSVAIKGIFFINVHLEYMSMSAKRVCLERLFSYIYSNKDRDIVLMGDFNMTYGNGYFREFVNKMRNIGICLINNSDNTYVGDRGKKILDYVFVSSGIKVIDSYICSDICISDHNPFVVKIYVKDPVG